MGRAPCCDKANVKRGPWSPDEDAKLKSYIEKHGTGGNWIALPQKIGLKRCGKSCRLRWLNYLRPNLKHGGFSEEEDNIICSLYISIGSRWSIIAAQLPGRTDNDIKNYWNTRLKNKLLGKQRKEHNSRRGSNALKQETIKTSNPSNINNLNPADQNHYRHWPALPLLNQTPLIPTQEQAFNDHNSIRKLLIKLGGKFSDDTVYNPQLIQNDNVVQFSPNSVYNQCSLNVSSSSANAVQLGEIQYNWSNGLQVLQGQSNFSGEITEIGCNNDERFDGLEFLLSDQSYGSQFSEMSSVIDYPEKMQRKILMNQDCGFDDRMRYNGC